MNKDDIILKDQDGNDWTFRGYNNNNTHTFGGLIVFGIIAFSFIFVGLNQAWPTDGKFLFWPIPKVILNFSMVIIGFIGLFGMCLIIHDIFYGDE